MATPTYRATGTKVNGTTSVALSQPTGTATYDCLVAFISDRATSGTTTAPTGWTRQGGVAGTGGRFQVFTAIKGLNGLTGTSWTWSSLTTRSEGLIVGYYNVHTGTPLNVAVSARLNAAGTFGTDLITPTVNGCMIVAAYAALASGATWSAESVATSPSITEFYDGANSTYLSIAIAEGIQATAGSTGASTATPSADQANAGILLALNPSVVITGSYSNTLATVTQSAAGTVALVPLVAIVDDSFNRGDVNPIGGSWATVAGYGDLKIASNKAVGATSGYNFAYYNAAYLFPDQYAQIVVGSIGSEIDILLRVDPLTNTEYALYLTPTSWGFYKYVNGAGPTFIGAGQSKTISAGLTVQFAVLGTSLIALFDGVVDSYIVSDSTITVAGFVGLLTNGTSDSIDSVYAGVIPRKGAQAATLATLTQSAAGTVVAPPASTVTDSFARANVNPIAGNWTTFFGLSPCQIIDNNLAGTADSTSNTVYWNANSFNANQFAECTFSNLTDSGVCCRMDTVAGTFYWLGVYADHIALFFRDGGGTYNNIGGSISDTWSAGKLYRLECFGTSIRTYIDGVLQHDIVDSSCTAGRVGVRMYYDVDRMNYWKAGNLASSSAILDTFHRADANPAGGNWTTVPGCYPLKTIGNECAATSSSNLNIAYWNADTFYDDQWVECTFSALHDSGPCARMSTDALYCYFFDVYTTYPEVHRVVNGVFTKISTSIYCPWASSNVYRLECIGSHVRAYINGALVFDYDDQDANALTSGRVGMFMYDGTDRMNYWAGGSDAGVVASLDDNFYRANANPIGSPWATKTPYSAIQLLSDQARGTNATGYSFARWDTLLVPDQYAQIVVGNLTGEIDIALRVQSRAATTAYMMSITPTGWQFGKFLNGSITLDTFQTKTITTGMAVLFAVVGNTLIAIFDGVHDAHTATDTSIPAPGYIGMVIYGTSDSVNSISGGIVERIGEQAVTLAGLAQSAAGTVASGYTLKQNLGGTPDNLNSFGWGSAAKWLAYSFVADSSYTVSQIGVGLLISAGTPLTSPLTCYLYSDASFSPGSLLGTSTNTHSDTLTESSVMYPFQFSGVALTSGTRYWVVLSLATPSGNYPAWSMLIGGTEKCYVSSDGASWSLKDSPEQGTIQLYATGGAAAITGSQSATLATVTASQAGTNLTHGAHAATLATVTQSAAGGVLDSGAHAATLATVTQTAAGGVRITGSASATLDAMTATQAGFVLPVISGAQAATLDGLTRTSAGAVLTHGAQAATLDTLTASQAGFVLPVISGAQAATFSALVQTATGTVLISGQQSAVLDALLSLATGTVAWAGVITGSSAQTLGTLTALSTAAVGIAGSAAQTLAGLSATEQGGVLVSGASAQTLGGLLQSATGAIGDGLVTGQSAQTLGVLTGAAQGIVLIVGQSAQTLGGLSPNQTGAIAIIGGQSAVLDLLTQVAAGTAGFTPAIGTSHCQLADLSRTSAGVVAICAIQAVTLTGIEASSHGAVAIQGQLSAVLDVLTQVAHGGGDVVIPLIVTVSDPLALSILASDPLALKIIANDPLALKITSDPLDLRVTASDPLALKISFT